MFVQFQFWKKNVGAKEASDYLKKYSKKKKGKGSK